MTKIIPRCAERLDSMDKVRAILGQAAFLAAVDTCIVGDYSAADAAAHLIECMESNEEGFGDGTGSTYKGWDAGVLVEVGLGFDTDDDDKVEADVKGLADLEKITEILIHHYAGEVANHA
jgi:hypothetical protein